MGLEELCISQHIERPRQPGSEGADQGTKNHLVKGSTIIMFITPY